MLPESQVPVRDVPGIDKFREWKPDAQRRALELLRQRETSSYLPFYCDRATCDGHPHDDWAWEHARADQRPPRWASDWLTLFFRGGRGSGKTRAGAEIVHKATATTPRIALIAATGPDFRDTMVEGISGILATSPPGKRPEWEPSKKRLTWPNGCIAQGFSAEEPDRLRGPQHGFAWLDEPCHYQYVDDVWDNLLFGLRIKGKFPNHVVATSSPLPSEWVRELVKDPLTITRQVSTYANLANLNETFRRRVVSRYEGTRIGRQELYGELLEDVVGALWKIGDIQYVDEPPKLIRTVVGVDPAGSANKRSDLTGIIVVGISKKGRIYVLADYSGRYSPYQWAKKVNEAVSIHDADAIVAEKNYGGDMVRNTLESAGYKGTRVIMVDSRKSKELRAEPIASRYEQHKAYHVGKREDLAKLAEEMTSWVPRLGPSPNRVDALVHASTELLKGWAPVEYASPIQVLSNFNIFNGRRPF